MGTDRLSRLRTATINRLRRPLGVIAHEDRLAELENAYSTDLDRVWELLDGHEKRIARIAWLAKGSRRG